MKNKYLVISSDDFGMTSSVNEGIRLAYMRGVLSSTNLMVPCPWFEHAAQLAEGMDIDIGVHLTLTGEWRNYRWRPLSGKSSLTGSSGYFYSSIRELMENAKRIDIVAECRAQINEVLSRKIPLAYIDLHMCIPSISGVLPNADYELELMSMVTELAGEFQIPYAYELENGRLRYFDTGLSISSKERNAIHTYLKNLDDGVHHLSCHCAVDSYEQSNLANATDENYPWASAYRRNDMRLILSDWFFDLIRRYRITIIKNHFSTHRNRLAQSA